MVIALIGIFASQINAASWPAFKRDNRRTGAAQETCYPPLTQQWAYDTFSEIIGSPAVYDDKVYIGTRSGSLYCFKARTDSAEVVWQYSTEGWIDATPYVYDDKVYIGAQDGVVYCFDAQTGDVEWSRFVGGQNSSSALVEDGMLYMGCAHPETKVVALSAKTGQGIWSRTIGMYSHSSPALRDGVVYIGCSNGSFYGI